MFTCPHQFLFLFFSPLKNETKSAEAGRTLIDLLWQEFNPPDSSETNNKIYININEHYFFYIHFDHSLLFFLFCKYIILYILEMQI